MIDDISPPGSWVRELSARPHTYRDVWAALREAEARLAALEAERDALRAALLPFSKLLGDHHDSDRDEKKVFGINGNDFTVGDLRRAKAARGGA